jgi:hypothetical protein
MMRMLATAGPPTQAVIMESKFPVVMFGRCRWPILFPLQWFLLDVGELRLARPARVEGLRG